MKLSPLNSSNVNIAKDLGIRSPDVDININSPTMNKDKPVQPNPMSNFNFLLPPHSLYGPRPNPNPTLGGAPPPRFMPPFIGPAPMPTPVPTSMLDAAIPRIFGASQQPPVTILVPYPIVLPFPIPIPIPLPLDVLIRAAEYKLKRDNPDGPSPASKCSDGSDSKFPLAAHQPGSPSPDQPLDFTKARETEAAPSTIRHYFNESDDESDGETVQPSANIDSRNRTQISDEEMNESGHPEPRLPKFKITRLHSRRTVAKESESSRPLRKRKRIIDCDYLHLKDGK